MRASDTAAVILFLMIGHPHSALAQADKSSPASSGGDAQQLIRAVTANELKAQKEDHTLWQYSERKQNGAKVTLNEIVETDQGNLHRLMAVNGQALSPDAERKEDARIRGVLSDPEEIQSQHKKAQRDGDTERRLLQLLPSAFVYQYVGEEGGLTKLTFAPNPSFSPSSREGQVFHHMEGTIWVDTQAKRIAKIEGRLISEVKFGGGFLGHLAQGGTFSIEQQNVGEGHWDIARLNVDINGKALFFKTISVHQKQEDSQYKPLPEGITLQQAAQLLQQPTTGRPATGAGGN